MTQGRVSINILLGFRGYSQREMITITQTHFSRPLGPAIKKREHGMKGLIEGFPNHIYFLKSDLRIKSYNKKKTYQNS